MDFGEVGERGSLARVDMEQMYVFVFIEIFLVILQNVLLWGKGTKKIHYQYSVKRDSV